MSDLIQIHPKWSPVLDPDFIAGSLWNREFRTAAQATGRAQRLAIALERADGSVSVDLLVRSLLALGASLQEVGLVIAHAA